MSVASLLGTPCSILRRTPAPGLGPFSQSYDDDGNVIYDDTPVQTTCSLQQLRRDEPSDQGEFSVAIWRLFLPTGTVIDTGDAVVVEGATYELVGAPWDAREGSAAVWHLEATVKRTA